MKSFGRLCIQYWVTNYIHIACCAMALLCLHDWITIGSIVNGYVYGFVGAATFTIYHAYYIRIVNDFRKWIFICTGILITLWCFIHAFNALHINYLVIISILSVVYCLFSWFSFRVGIVKPIWLSAIWFMTTQCLTSNSHPLNINYLSYAAYQWTFIFLLCLWFYIKDEIPIANQKLYYLITDLLQIILWVCAIILCKQMGLLAWGFIFSNVAIFIIRKRILSGIQHTFFYQFYVDGLMLIAPIFVGSIKLFI